MSAARVPGFPEIGRTIPAAVLIGLGVVAGLVGSFVAVGLSPWLVISLLLLLAAAVGPRGPFAAILVVQLAIATVATGPHGYTGRFVVVLVAAHLLFSIGALTGWLPTGARVQVAVLRRPLLRFVGVQVAAQIVAYLVLTLASRGDTGPAAAGADAVGGAGGGLVWLGIVGAAAAVVMAIVVLAPVLLRPDDD